MFVIDKIHNRISKINSKTFHELGFKERENLQEWIAQNPSYLGDEELLIIQKEFDGFDDTNERLDLLALDKAGSLVVIENKLDDTGRDAVWQVLKYVSYCSTLSKQQVIEIYQAYLDKNGTGENAVDKLVEFFDDVSVDELSINDQDQRMILVAGNFRKEVTSTVMWMLNHGISVQCFKTTPYQYQEDLLLDIEQIIPVKETADYVIKMADKVKEAQVADSVKKGLKVLRKEYWTQLLERFNTVSTQFQNVNPTDDHWLSSGSGVSGISFSFLSTKSYAGVELMINNGEKEINEKIFDSLYDMKDVIEEESGLKIEWQKLEEKKSCRIFSKLQNVDISNRDDWDKMIEFHCNTMPKFYNAIHDRVNKVVKG